MKKKRHQSFSHYSNTPLLQTVPAKSGPGLTKGDTPNQIKMESPHNGSPSLTTQHKQPDHLHWFLSVQ
jgi:hypothetical protein